MMYDIPDQTFGETSSLQASAESAFLTQFSNFLSEHVAPLASQMDRDPDTLNHVFEAFKAQSGLTIRIPSQEGGTFLSDCGFASYRIELARYCGSLSFLQAQHQVAVTWLSKSTEPDKVRPLYQQILQEGVALGIGFLSPRHKSFEVKKENRHYILSGDIPWITGHGFLHHGRVRRRHCCRPLPSEPGEPVTWYTAQAIDVLQEALCCCEFGDDRSHEPTEDSRGPLSPPLFFGTT